ncbi:MAG TPA: asparaginase [Candidatus Polarisedimenticolia bacterium]|nr:asparaginase [Candidatus Polarisedimenticolia bacterium]
MPAPKVSKSSAQHGYVPLVEIRRGDSLESMHFGALVVVDSGGRTVAAAGDPGLPVVLRSTAKPAQVLPLLDTGAADRFRFSDEAIAVMIGSHGGEEFHVAAVRSILRVIGLGEAALQCGAHAPYHKPSARALRERGEEPGALHNNCSGKHAGMLALAVHLGAPTESYLEPGHPVQTAIRARIESLAGLPSGRMRTAIDGCSAPTFEMPLSSLAFLYARLAAACAGSGAADGAARRAVAAMRGHPEMIGGTDRLCTELMRSGRHGLLAKIGAEGMYGLAWERDGVGLGLALKISDGEGQRSRVSAALEALRQLEVLSDRDAGRMRDRFVGEIRNHGGLLVGSIATTFRLV